MITYWFFYIDFETDMVINTAFFVIKLTVKMFIALLTNVIENIIKKYHQINYLSLKKKLKNYLLSK